MSSFDPQGFPPRPDHQSYGWYGGYGAPLEYPGYPVPRPTNALAIAALVSALVFAPLGIVFGHISLSQIKRTGEDGRGMAIAGLVIGYVVTALAVVTLVALLAFAAVIGSAMDSSRTAARHRHTTSPSEVPNQTARTIKNAKVGDCIRRVPGTVRKDGTRDVTVSPATCGSSSATDKVTKRTTKTSDCPDDEWVETKAYQPPIVLCLSKVR